METTSEKVEEDELSNGDDGVTCDKATTTVIDDGAFPITENDAKSEIEVENCADGVDTMSHHLEKRASSSSEIGIEFRSICPCSHDQVPNGDPEPTNGSAPATDIVSLKVAGSVGGMETSEKVEENELSSGDDEVACDKATRTVIDDGVQSDGAFPITENDAKSEIELENCAVGVDTMSDHLEKRASSSSEIGIEFGSVYPCSDDQVPNGDPEPTNGSAPGFLVNGSHQNESLPEVEHPSAISSTDLPSNGVVSEILAGSVGGMEYVLNSSEKGEDELSTGDGVTRDKATTVIDGVQSDGVPTTLPESSKAASAAISVEDLFTSLNRHIQRSDFQQAVKVADQVLLIAPDDEDAIHCKIVALVSADNIDQALSTIIQFQSSSKKFPSNFINFFKAYCFYRQNRLDDALKCLEGLEENSASMLLESQILYRLGRLDASVDLYRKLQKSKIESLEINLVGGLVSAGKASEMQGVLDTLRVKATSSFELAYNVACVLIEKNNYSDAEQLLLSARRIGQETLMEDDLAEDELEIELAPIAVQLAYVQHLLGNTQDAAVSYTDIIKPNLAYEPPTAVAINNSVSLKGSKAISDSLQKLDLFIEKSSGGQSFQLSHGLDLKLSSKQKEAIYTNRMLLLLHSNQMDQARELAATLPDMFPGSVAPLLLQAAVLVRENKAGKAEELLGQFAEKFPDKSNVVLLARAQVAAAAGHPQIASESLAKIPDIQHMPATLANIASLKETSGDVDGGAVNPTSEILAGSVGGMETVLNSSEKVEDELSGDGVTCDKATTVIDGVQSDGAFPITENVPTFSSDYSNHGADIERDDKNGEDGLCCACNDAKSEIEVENCAVGDDTMSDHLEKRASSEIGIESGSIGPRQKAPSLWCDDVPNGDPEPTNGSAPGYLVNGSHQNESLPDLESGFEAEHSSAISSTDLPSEGDVNPTSENPTSEILSGSVGGMETVLNSSEKVEDESSGDGVTCDKATVIDGVQSDGVPTTLPESSISGATDRMDIDTEVITKPFYFLIKIPRFEDEKLSEKIRLAQLQVDERTQERDAIKAEMRKKRANCQAYWERFEAAKAEERTARRSVKSKRQEIDSLQSVINRVKNAISVEEIDKRIYGMEHMIQHETFPLKEEKEFIREIKRLKHLREQLSSNMGSQDEVQQALDQKDQNEDHLKKLKKELENLKNTVLKAEAIKISAGKKYDEESKRLKELQAQWNAANDIRQEAFGNMLRLRGQLNEKRTNFHVYKDDAKAAFDYASCGDKEALHRLCVDQVDQLMRLWNTVDEFRKEYVRCNIRSTVRRLRTLDGRSLGPDEEPPVLPAYVDERVGRRLISVPSQAKPISVVANVEQEKQVSSAEEKQADEKSIEVAEQKIQTVETRETAKLIVLSGSATVSGRDDKVEKDKKEEEEEIPSKEEQELARKAMELRKAEIEAKLKEQRRLEEKAKAKEAQERKKRNQEKAQMRAELRAQKEAEEKEKETEKRLRKKEKKKSGPGGDVVHENNNNGEDAAAITTIVNGSEVKESNSNSMASASKKPPPQKAWFVKQQSSKPKPIPPPLRNRGKRRMQQLLWMISVAAIVLILFLLGNTGFFLNLRQRKAAGNL